MALFENTNFQDFVRKVSLFSDKAPFEEKLRFMFTVWDVDGDGRISQEDLEHVLRQRAGSSLSEGELRAVAQRVLREAGVEAGGAWACSTSGKSSMGTGWLVCASTRRSSPSLASSSRDERPRHMH